MPSSPLRSDAHPTRTRRAGINHFNEWLQQVQAKESTDIGEDIMQQVMEELYARRITDVADINAKKVREILKSLKLRKTYEHVVQLTSKLTGKPAFTIPPEAEEMCRLMFIAVQPAFDKHCPKDRKNFLSYAYCARPAPLRVPSAAQCVVARQPPLLPAGLYKFFQLLGYDELLETFSLLKGRDKLQKQDQIFQLMCAPIASASDLSFKSRPARADARSSTGSSSLRFEPHAAVTRGSRFPRLFPEALSVLLVAPRSHLWLDKHLNLK